LVFADQLQALLFVGGVVLVDLGQLADEKGFALVDFLLLLLDDGIQAVVLFLKLLYLRLQHVYVVVIERLLLESVLDLQVLVLQLQNQHFVLLYSVFQLEYLLQQVLAFQTDSPLLETVPILDEDSVVVANLVAFLRVAGVFMLNVSFLAGAFRMPQSAYFLVLEAVAAFDFTKVVGLQFVEVAIGVGVSVFLGVGLLGSQRPCDEVT
jgi:hypothetical protein